MQLPDYKAPVIIKNNNFTFYPGKSRENFETFSRTFQDLKTKFKDFQGLSRTAKKIHDFPGLFQDVATLLLFNKTHTAEQPNLFRLYFTKKNIEGGLMERYLREVIDN